MIWFTILTFIAFGNYFSLADETITYKKPLLRSVRFIDEKHGWITGYKGIFYTKDGGNEWLRQPINVGSIQEKEGTVSNIETGFLIWASRNQAIIRGENSLLVGDIQKGQWNAVDLPKDTIINIPTIVFVDNRNGWGVNRRGYLYETRDLGKTWEMKKIANHIYGLLAVSTNEIWVAVDGAVLLHSKNFGASFEKYELPVDSDNYGSLPEILNIHFVSSTHGWAIGTDGLICHTSDGGKSWKKQDTGLTKGTILKAISFLNEREGWVVGSQYERINNTYRGIILYTDDGGNKWQLQTSNIRERLLDVQARSNGLAWAVGEDGIILKTTNRGKDWLSVKIE